MSLEQIKQAVQNFALSRENEFIVIKGSWGVGKTYFWNSIVQEAQNNKNLGKQFYSYVSLFGINTLEELKQAIFAGIAGQVLINRGVRLPNWLQRLQGSVSEAGNALSDISKNIPLLKDLPSGLLSTALFMALQDTVICLDDIERRGSDLDIKGILGLCSFLKEQRDCKIAFIVNVDALEAEEVAEFKRHSEKVVDVEVRFAPTSDEAFNYVFSDGEPYIRIVRQCCITLEIKNIRTIQRVKRLIKRIWPSIEHSDEEVKTVVLQNLVLYIWAHYDKESNPPSFAFLKNHSTHRMNFLINKINLSDEEKRWNQILSSYGYAALGLVSEHLMQLVESGHTNFEAFSGELQKQEQLIQVLRVRNLHDKVWDLYNSTFDDNEDELINALMQSFHENSQLLTLSNLQNAVGLLRDLNHNDVANELIETFLALHRENIPKSGEMDSIIFMSGIKDEYLVHKLREIYNNPARRPSFREAVRNITAGSWSDMSAETINNAAMEEYYHLFKTERSQDLYMYIKTCMNRVGPAAHQKTKQALRIIANESRLNAIRIKNMYEIDLGDSDDES